MWKRRVIELRKGLRKVRTMEEMVRQFETDLSCSMVTASVW